ncbi:DNA polymerase [Acinetobacter phage vB_AbaM_D22]|nr:DNA polymerase [Acinetobacter phage vB_AbaM_D22]
MTEERKYRFFAADLEATGLLWDMVKQGDEKKLHNFCAIEIKDHKFQDITLIHPHNKKGLKELQEFIEHPDHIFLIHNAYTYDIHALELFGIDTSKMKVIDTLPLSWYLHHDRDRHGLEWWGEEFGVPKPKIDNWEDLTQEEYDHRVIEDCKIQRLLWMKLCTEFGEMYKVKTQKDVYEHFAFKYIQFKSKQLSEQMKNKWKFNVEKCQELFDELHLEIAERTEKLKSVMPPVPKYAKRKPPAKPYKTNGELSATGEKWKNLCETYGYDFETYKGEIQELTKYEEPNPASSAQVKAWLTSLGWEPMTFEYKREADGKTRAIPQVNKKNSGGLVCESVSMLAEEVEEVSALEGLGIVKHRYSMAKGWLENHEDGYLIAQAGGFTNTLRLKHRQLVNMPSGRVPYGMRLRGLLEAREGCVLTGADLSSLENRWKFHHQYPLDPDYVEAQMSDDFDPHLALAVMAGLLTADDENFYKIFESGYTIPDECYTEELKSRIKKAEGDEEWMHSEIKRIAKIRGIGKNGNYALQYGSGVETLARTAKITKKQATKLKEGYDKLNWTIPVIAKAQRVKDFKHGRFLFNKENKLWYPLKAEKDRFSTLIQGSGSYTLDLWIMKFFQLRKKAIASGRIKFARLLGQFHDEKIIESLEEDAEEIKKMIQEAIVLVNKSLKLTVELTCDIKQGGTYADIH